MEKKVSIVVDMVYGDTGKGTVTDYLSSLDPGSTVIRYNGGPQAGHNVITPSGLQHTFSQFGSGTFWGSKTYISRFTLVNPLNFLSESEHLQSLIPSLNPFSLVTIDKEAQVITPFEISAGRIRELLRKENKHGSCGEGIGEMGLDQKLGKKSLRISDLLEPSTLHAKLASIQERKIEQIKPLLVEPMNENLLKEWKSLKDTKALSVLRDLYLWFAKQVSLVEGDYLGTILESGSAIFEGAQGVLLDGLFGFHPYTTWSNTTAKNAKDLLKENNYINEVTTYGLFRGYYTRHGAGPFITEDSLLSEQFQDSNNQTNPWQDSFRVGHFDLVAARYALECCKDIDKLIFTNLDRMVGHSWKVATNYKNPAKLSVPANRNEQEQLTKVASLAVPVYKNVKLKTPAMVNQYVKELSRSLKLPIALTSWGKTYLEKTIPSPISLL